MTKKVLVPIAAGTEEIEAFCIINVLRRAGAEVVVASVGEKEVSCSRGVKIVADALIGECKAVSFDMIALPGDTTEETIAAIMADEMAIGVINNKTTATRLIPVPGKKAGDNAYFGGLLGQSTIIPVNNGHNPNPFVRHGGLIPAPIQSLTN